MYHYAVVGNQYRRVTFRRVPEAIVARDPGYKKTRSKEKRKRQRRAGLG